MRTYTLFLLEKNHEYGSSLPTSEWIAKPDLDPRILPIQHRCDLQAYSLDEVFVLAQFEGAMAHPDFLKLRCRSLSDGDMAYDQSDQTFHVCLRTGWLNVAAELRDQAIHFVGRQL